MIPLLPTPYAHFACPTCTQPVAVRRTVFAGIRTLAHCICAACGTDCYADYPVGHALHYPMAVGAHPPHTLYNNVGKWWADPLLQGVLHPNTTHIDIKKHVLKPTKNVVILNCIDYLYGHALLKLFNAQAHLTDPNADLIVIVQRNFEWLVPQGCAEVWVVDLPLRKAQDWYTRFDDFVQNELKRFDNVQLSLAFSHLPNVDIQKFVGIPPFDLQKFADQMPQITFIWRNDRLWHSHRIYEKMHRLCKHFGLMQYIEKGFLWLQHRQFARTFTYLKKHLPQAQIHVVGIGRAGGFAPHIHDGRVAKITDDTEKYWCQIYAQSHLVVGIHGSNMILPTALAAGFIEILPQERHANITQDVLLRHNGNIALYLSRFVHEFITPAVLGGLIKNMVQYFPHFYMNNAPQHTHHQVYDNVGIWYTLRRKYFEWTNNLQ
jgi:hypothetical protein